MLRRNWQKIVAFTLLLLAGAFAITAWQFALANNAPYQPLPTATPGPTDTPTPVLSPTPDPLATPTPPQLLISGSGPEALIVSPDYPILTNAFLHQQRHSLSCESASVYIASTMLGVVLDEDAVLSSLPKSENPFVGFRGNIDGPIGGIVDYGVYAPPIVAAVNQLGTARGLQARQISGEQELRAELAQGHPVIVWITSALKPSTRLEQNGYYLVPHEHAVVVVGITPAYILVSDVGDGKPRAWSLERFRASWQLFEYQGVALKLTEQ